MTDSLNEFSATLTQRLVDFLWTQWSSLGMAGYSYSPSASIADPEALLLLSTRIARHDSRLFDEILDWLRENGTWINLQRLKHLLKEHRFADTAVLGAIAEALASETNQVKWKLLLRRLPHPETPEPEPLMRPNRFFGNPEPTFAKWGLLRGPLEFRGMSQPPPTDQPAAFLFKLRALFGNQARAEIMAWLLANESGHPAEIARQVGYFRRTVQLVLNEFSQSGHIKSVRVGREKHFSILHEDWHFLIHGFQPREFPRWIQWAPIFQALLRINDALALPGLDSKSERIQAIKLREALEDAMSSLTQAGIAAQFRTTPELKGSELTRSLLADLDTLLG